MSEIGMVDAVGRAAELDASDPLAGYLDQFLPSSDGSVRAYLDGNSLGRPPRAVAQAMSEFIQHRWGTRLIRGWTDEWMDWPTVVGDELGAAALGAAAGRTVIADSTSVLIYKLARAALTTVPGRREIVVDIDNFPSDRYVVEQIATELGLTLRWVEVDPATGITLQRVQPVLSDQTAFVVASHVAYRSGFIADVPAITEAVHRVGGRVLWDLSHSVGSVPIALDAWNVDFAVGCGYKYLNGGPGAPAFGYVAADLQDRARQPIPGWMGHAYPFEMGPGYTAHRGIRGFLTGTPPILAMVPLRIGVAMVAEAGIWQIRAKSLGLTDFALELVDDWLAPYGVTVASPRNHGQRGGHLTIRREGFQRVNEQLWERGVIGDFRAPDGIRLGPAALSTSYAEIVTAVAELRSLLAQDTSTQSRVR